MNKFALVVIDVLPTVEALMFIEQQGHTCIIYYIVIREEGPGVTLSDLLLGILIRSKTWVLWSKSECSMFKRVLMEINI